MKIRISLLLALSPLCALAQGVVYVPSPSIPGQGLPFSQYGVMIGGAAEELPEYNIDINGDGIVDYTLTINAGLGSIWQFNIVPKGNNSVLAYVDSIGGVDAINLGAGQVVGPQSSSLNPIWVNPGNGFPPTINYFVNNDVIGQTQWEFGTFLNTTGFIGLQFWVNNQAYYGFLQMDTRFSPLYGGMYQGYGWNTTPGDSITATYFRDTLQVPEPSTSVLLALFGIVAGLVRRRHFLK
jgi:hypothetical protein